MSAPTIWFFLMLCAIVIWSSAIKTYPEYFWGLTNAVAWVGALAFMAMTETPSWLLIGSFVYAVVAIPAGLILTKTRSTS